jgi:hypothetical protein
MDTVPKLREGGLRATIGVGAIAPVPDTLIATVGVAGSLLLITMEPVLFPALVAVKVTLSVVLAPAATEKGAGGDQEKSVLVPVPSAMPVTSSGAVPVFDMVTGNVVGTPIVAVPKGSVVGLTPMIGAADAVTVKALVATISCPCAGLVGSGVQRGPKNVVPPCSARSY